MHICTVSIPNVYLRRTHTWTVVYYSIQKDIFQGMTSDGAHTRLLTMSLNLRAKPIPTSLDADSASCRDVQAKPFV